MKRKSRILAVFFLLILTVSFLPVTAAAACTEHDFEYIYLNATYCQGTCSKCGATTNKTVHSYTRINDPATCEKSAYNEVKCKNCGNVKDTTSYGRPNGHTAEADDGNPTTAVRCVNCDAIIVPASNVGVSGMDQFAFRIYKIIAAIAMPLAIISLASCGFKFLSSIFFGNYASMAGNDAMKAQKQFVMTILAVLFIILLPTIFGGAIRLFQINAWEPG